MLTPLRLWVRRQLGSRPATLDAFLWATRVPRALWLSPSTDIVIDGYPRSANTFAYEAFRSAQPREVRIAHHVHVAGHVRKAVRLGVPTVVLIRPPADAITSYRLFDTRRSSAACLTEWLLFYRSVEDVLGQTVVADFARVTSDFGSVIDSVNERFGTAFARFEHTDESETAIREHIRWDAGNRYPDGTIGQRVATPTSEREQRGAETREELGADPRLRDRLRTADALYERIVAAHCSPLAAG